jgi:hypothetical protein
MERNEELALKVDALIILLWAKTQVHTRNPYNPTWKSQNYGTNFPNPNPTGAPNNNMGVNNGNVSALGSTFKAFMQTQTGQIFYENHDYIINKLSTQAISIKQDVKAFQERTKSMET